MLFNKLFGKFPVILLVLTIILISIFTLRALIIKEIIVSNEYFVNDIHYRKFIELAEESLIGKYYYTGLLDLEEALYNNALVDITNLDISRETDGIVRIKLKGRINIIASLPDGRYITDTQKIVQIPFDKAPLAPLISFEDRPNNLETIDKEVIERIKNIFLFIDNILTNYDLKVKNIYNGLYVLIVGVESKDNSNAQENLDAIFSIYFKADNNFSYNNTRDVYKIDEDGNSQAQRFSESLKSQIDKLVKFLNSPFFDKYEKDIRSLDFRYDRGMAISFKSETYPDVIRNKRNGSQ